MLKHFLETGKIVNTHGLKGEVRVQPWCDTPSFLKDFEGFYIDNGKTFLKAASIKVANEMVIMKFDGIDDINAAMPIINKVIYIDREWVKLPKGSYFEQDLIGLSVEDASTGVVYGKLSEVGHTGANDIYRVDKDGREVWIPAIKQIIKSIDLDAEKMLITPIKGLFDDED